MKTSGSEFLQGIAEARGLTDPILAGPDSNLKRPQQRSRLSSFVASILISLRFGCDASPIWY